MKSSLARDIFLVFFAGFMAFFVVPIFLIGNNPDDYQFADIRMFLYSSVIFSGLLGAFFSIVCSILHLFRLGKTSRYLASYLVMWIVVAGLFLPVSISNDMVDPEINSVDKLNFVLAVIIAGFLTFISRTKARNSLVVFVAVTVFATISLALIQISQSLLSASTSDSLILSKNRNILVLSFDGVPGEVVSDQFRENSQYGDIFKDFVLFNNAVSQGPATDSSMLGELFGVRDFQQMGANERAIVKKLEADGLVDALLLNRVPDSYSYHYKFGKKIRIPSPIATFDFFRYPIVRIWTRLVFNFLDWKRDARAILMQLLESTRESNLTLKMTSGSGPKWDGKYIATILEYEHFINELSVADKDLSVRFLHFTFTHFPVDFDENCQFRSGDDDWYKNNQNSEGVRREAICALSQFSVFIEKLKDLKIYDNSLIVLKSDHGQPASYFDEYPRDLRVNGSGRLGYNRYRPTLLIKDFAAERPTVTVEDKLVLLNDLAKTLCLSSNLGQDCEIFPGVDLLGNFSEDSAGPYYLYVPKTRKGSHSFKTFESVFIPSRKLSLLNAMQASGMINLSGPDNTRNNTQE